MIPPGPLPILPLARPVTATWTPPGSKSITNRALLLAALAEGSSELQNCLDSDDTRHMRRCLGQMGIAIEDLGHGRLLVHGGRSQLRPPPSALFVGNSGTTVRFLAAVAASLSGTVTLVGDHHMVKRPIDDLLAALRSLGTLVECPSGCPPITLHARGLRGGKVMLRADRSSQFLSALLMAGAYAEAPITIELVGEQVSRPYIRMTAAMIQAFGGRCEETETGWVVHPAEYHPRTWVVEPDASAASYPAAVAAATGSTIMIGGLHRGSLQGDVGFLDCLERAGCTVTWQANAVTVRGGRLRGQVIDMHDISDTAMTLAALAPLAEGETRIENIANIRIKETDRLSALVNELTRLGQDVSSGESWIAIRPRPITAATIRCYSDHRMAMSFAVLGLARPGICIEDPGCVAKTYPTFWRDLGLLYVAQGQRPAW